MKHRTDIDGLRAIAVMPILLFHAGISILPGGFLGVDIFFVISGFLITGILMRDMDADRFSILTFYRRRIVRIFPALFLMLAAVLIVATQLQLPNELEKTGWASASAAAFVSNIRYWRSVDYFGGFAEMRPLLHTWSLGVEEQFYIFFPLFLLIVRRWARAYVRQALIAVVILSFLAALVMAAIQPAAAFYLLPARAWQLALGGLVAVGVFPQVAQQSRRDALAGCGLAMIVIAILIVQEDWALPAPWGLLPSLGAALLIAYGEDSVTHRLLRLPALRWIGAISYSLYLWHWPIITFYRLEKGLSLTLTESALLVAASFAAAAASFYLVERPMLRRFREGPSKPIVTAGGLALAASVAAAVGVAAYPTGWRKIDPEVDRIARFAEYVDTGARAAQYREGLCFATSKHPTFDYALCTTPDPRRRDVALVGDSHAAQYWLALQQRLPQDHVMQVTASGCRLILNAQGEDRCTKLNRYVYGDMLKNKEIEHVVLAGRWRAEDVEDLVKSIGYFKTRGVAVTVIGPTDEFEGDFPLLLARAIEMRDLAAMESFRLRSMRSLEPSLERRVREAGANYVSVQDVECPGNTTRSCRYLTQNGTPLHFDYGHLTQDGAAMLLKNFPAI
ncbi:acyltransferase family protein [Sphingobium algorifonticola]|nr:acyltransferase family protein [Sphingobium algorifonticola]